MRPAPHSPKCRCQLCVEWRVEVRAAHDERERRASQLPMIRVPHGFLASLVPSPVFEHDLT